MATSPTSLPPVTVASLLRGAAAIFAAEARALPVDVARWHPAEGEWCVNDVLGHIIEAERRGFAGRIRIILASDRPALERWDPAEVAKARKDCDKNAGDLASELVRMRDESAELVSALSASDLRRSGMHPAVGELAVSDLLQEWVHHDANHLKQILTNVQLYAWPHMGNAQKFSRP